MKKGSFAVVGILLIMLFFGGCAAINTTVKSSKGISDQPEWVSWNTEKEAKPFYFINKSVIYKTSYTGDVNEAIKSAKLKAMDTLDKALNKTVDADDLKLFKWIDATNKEIYILASESKISDNNNGYQIIDTSRLESGAPIWTKWDINEIKNYSSAKFLSAIATAPFGQNVAFSESTAINRASGNLAVMIGRNRQETTGIKSGFKWRDQENKKVHTLAYIDASLTNEGAQEEEKARLKREQEEMRLRLAREQELAKNRLKDQDKVTITQVNTDNITFMVTGDSKVPEYRTYLAGLKQENPNIGTVYVINIPGKSLEFDIVVNDKTISFSGTFDQIKAEISNHPAFTKIERFRLKDNDDFIVWHANQKNEFAIEYKKVIDGIEATIYVRPKNGGDTEVYTGKGKTRQEAKDNAKKK